MTVKFPNSKLIIEDTAEKFLVGNPPFSSKILTPPLNQNLLKIFIIIPWEWP